MPKAPSWIKVFRSEKYMFRFDPKPGETYVGNIIKNTYVSPTTTLRVGLSNVILTDVRFWTLRLFFQVVKLKETVTFSCFGRLLDVFWT